MMKLRLVLSHLTAGLIFAGSIPALAAQDPVSVGATPNNDKGDPFRTAAIKLNRNDAELYASIASIQAVLASLTAANPVTSVAGRRGQVTLSSTDLSDATSLGRSILNSTAAGQVLSAIGGAPSTNPVFAGAATMPRLAITGSGSTGDLSAMSVTPSASAAAGTLAKVVADKAPLANPTFTGSTAAPAASVSGGQTLSIQPTANPFNALSSFGLNAISVSETTPEFFHQVNCYSTKGGTNTGATEYLGSKVCGFVGMAAAPGSGPVGAMNTVLSLGPGAINHHAINVEIDTNNVSQHFSDGNLTGGPGDTPVGADLYIAGATDSNRYRLSGAILVNGTGGLHALNRGIAFYNGTINKNTFEDTMTVGGASIFMSGSKGIGIDMGSMTPTTGFAMRLPSNGILGALNAAGTSTRQLLKLNPADVVEIATGGTSIFPISGNSALQVRGPISLADGVTLTASSSDGSAQKSLEFLGTAIQFTGPVTLGSSVKLAGVPVAGLPTCNTAAKGAMYYVTDATSPTYNGALTGGGAVAVPAFCNGSAWSAH